jgi:hypothetical protein
VQTYVDDLLVNPAYRFVAQSGTLIALLRTEAVYATAD